MERIWIDLAAEDTRIPPRDWAATEATRWCDAILAATDRGRLTARLGSELAIQALAKSLRYHPLFDFDVLSVAEWYNVRQPNLGADFVRVRTIILTHGNSTHGPHLVRTVIRTGNPYLDVARYVNDHERTMTTTKDHDDRIANMTFASVYPHYVAKVEKKGRTVQELHQVISWLTGFKAKDLQRLIKNGVTFKQFFAEATINPNASLITGSICGYRIEEIETPLTRQARYLDKLVDELAKGRKMEKILRSP